MVLVHLNMIGRTACCISTKYVYVTNIVDNVNCIECKKTPEFTAEKEKEKR